MKSRQWLLAGVTLFALQGAFADDGYLRLRCEGDAAGATVSINGVKKGECPLDLAVPEGNVKLSVRKVVDQYRYRLFEREFFLAAGAMKRETVVLVRVERPRRLLHDPLGGLVVDRKSTRLNSSHT